MSIDMRTISRLNKEAYFMAVATIIASRGTCDRRHVGAVITDEIGNILSTGYNGAPAGHAHCSEYGHIMVGDKCVRTMHAELNAMLRVGGRQAYSLYTTDQPCVGCFNAAAQLGIKRIVFINEYLDAGRNAVIAEKCIDSPVLIHYTTAVTAAEEAFLIHLKEDLDRVFS